MSRRSEPDFISLGLCLPARSFRSSRSVIASKRPGRPGPAAAALESFLDAAATPLHAALPPPPSWRLTGSIACRPGEEPQAADYVMRFSPAVGAAIESIRRRSGRREHRRRPARASAWENIALSRQVGRGGMGVVYEAVHESLGRRVAIKLMPGLDMADPTGSRAFLARSPYDGARPSPSKHRADLRGRRA